MIRVADNLQIVNPIIHAALKDRNPAPIRDLVIRCEKAGAQAIDINSGPLTRNPSGDMVFLVEAVQSVTRLPLLLDSTNPRAIEAGLRLGGSRFIINGFSLEPRKIEAILPLAGRFDVEIIAYLLYPDSRVPSDETERLRIALMVYEAFQKTGLPGDRLIIDPVIAPLMWENGNIQDMGTLSVIRNLPDLLGFPVRTIAGISNLTTGPGPAARKRLLEAAYIPMLAASGLSFALMNMFHELPVAIARACEALADPGIFTYEALDG